MVHFGIVSNRFRIKKFDKNLVDEGCYPKLIDKPNLLL
jgi:hypothetical protein